MTCAPSTTFGVPEPAGDTSAWIQALAADPDGEATPGYRNRELLAFHRRPPTPAGAVYREEVVYGHAGGRPLTLRLYARACPGAARPAVLFFHGGGWASGDPSWHMRHAHGLAERGFVTALVSYRLLPETRWPGPLHDAKCAVRWLRAHADDIGADPGRIAVSGLSAGGQLAALVGLTPGWEEGDGGHDEVSSTAQAMVLWYPVVSLPALGRTDDEQTVLEEFFGAPLDDPPAGASPLDVAISDPPPTLLLTGDADETTTADTVRAFHEALSVAGGDAELVVYPGREHAFTLLPDQWEESFLDARDFLERLFGRADEAT